MNGAAAVGIAMAVALLLPAKLASAQGGSSPPTDSVVADPWVFTETVSPLDYAPVVIANGTSSFAGEGTPLQLSIQCRRGRTDVILLSPALSARAEDHRVSYALDGGSPTTLAVVLAPAGKGLAIREDLARLLIVLPSRGELVVQVSVPGREPLEGRYALEPLNKVLTRMAEPCRWPAMPGKPRPTH